MDGADLALYLFAALVAATISILGGLVSAVEPRRKKAFLWLGILSFLLVAAIGVKHYFSAKALKGTAEKAEKQRQQALSEQRNLESRTLAQVNRIQVRLDYLEKNAKSTEQKIAVKNIKKELQYDPVVLHHMTNDQLRTATTKLAKEMIALDSNTENETETLFHLETNWIVAHRANLAKRVELGQEYGRKAEEIEQRERSDYLENFMNRASAVRDELLFRLRETPDQSEKYVVSTLSPLGQSTHRSMSMSRALDGILVGPEPITDAATYLDALARRLN